MSPRRSDPLDELEAAIHAFTGRRARAEERRRFAKYLELLLRWNRTHRLTGHETARDVVRKLFIDSLLFLPLLPPRPHSMVDIGAGAGIPGLPLRIVDPGISLTLVESRRKAASFLATAARELGLADTQVAHGRAEELVSEESDYKAKYDVAVMRAVGFEPELVGSVLTYLKPGGLLIASGPPAARTAEVAPAGARVQHVPYPPLALQRTFLIFQR